MTQKEMCNSCTHEDYCMGAYRKNHWCGNHTRKDRKYEVSKMRKRGKQAVGYVESRQQDNDM